MSGHSRMIQRGLSQRSGESIYAESSRHSGDLEIPTTSTRLQSAMTEGVDVSLVERIIQAAIERVVRRFCRRYAAIRRVEQRFPWAHAHG